MEPTIVHAVAYISILLFTRRNILFIKKPLNLVERFYLSIIQGFINFFGPVQ